MSSVLLQDPVFAVNNATVHSAAPVEDDGDVASAASATSPTLAATGSSAFTLGSHSVSYGDFPEEAKQLDQTLYNIPRINVKGTKNALFSHVTFNSYVQGIIVLYQHNHQHIQDGSHHSRFWADG